MCGSRGGGLPHEVKVEGTPGSGTQLDSLSVLSHSHGAPVPHPAHPMVLGIPCPASGANSCCPTGFTADLPGKAEGRTRPGRVQGPVQRVEVPAAAECSGPGCTLQATCLKPKERGAEGEAAELLALRGVDMQTREHFWKLVEVGGWRMGWEVFR